MTLELIVRDSLEWLPKNKDQGSIITSLPDISELGMTDVDEYKAWIQRAVTLCIESTSSGSPTYFYQTDRKWNGSIISKFATICDVVAQAGDRKKRLILHKIVLRREVGKVDLHRPGYSHLFAFGDESCKPGKATPDVIASGNKLYSNAMDSNAVQVALDMCAKASTRVLDPFCGMGSVPIAAAKMGLYGLGIDIDAGMISKAQGYAGSI